MGAATGYKVLTRGTPYTLLQEYNSMKVKSVAYADDVVTVSGKLFGHNIESSANFSKSSEQMDNGPHANLELGKLFLYYSKN